MDDLGEMLVWLRRLTGREREVLALRIQGTTFRDDFAVRTDHTDHTVWSADAAG